MLAGMELRHLRYFVVVAEEQNITRAAARLHVSQPPLSRQIHDLEEELGVSLFRRTAKSITLTEAGKIFLREAREVLLRAEKAVETVRVVARGERGQLRIGYAPSLTVELLPKALRLFEHGHPGVRVSLHDLSTEESVQRLKARKLDVALTVRPSSPRMRGLAFQKLTEYELCCAVGISHPFAGRRSLALGQLRDERFMVYSREDYPEYLEWLVELFRPCGFVPHAAEEYDSVTGLIAAVEAGRGIAIMTSSLRCLMGPGLKLLPLKPKLPLLVLGALSFPPETLWTEKFIAAVRQAVRKE